MTSTNSIGDPYPYEQAQRDYHEAIQHFEALQTTYTRTATCGRSFILVESLTRELRQPISATHNAHRWCHNLDRLRVASYVHATGRPAEITLDKLDTCLAIFYTLLEINRPHLIHHFYEAGLTDAKLPLTEDDIGRATKGLSFDQDGFHSKFFTEQYKWCPVVFDLEMELHCYDRIVPIYRSRHIKQARDRVCGPALSDGRPVLLAVEVPEELVSSTLQAALPKPRERTFKNDSDPTDRNPGFRYVFALKRFLAQDHYSQEKSMLKALNGREGIISFLGGYTTQLPDHAGNAVEYCHIMLELAQGDLYKVLRDEVPPALPGEIKRWWTEMLQIAKALRSVHENLKADNVPFHMWHCDVKPENILRVDDSFKLADPGEAVIKLATDPINIEPVAHVRSGTKAFAAPEKAALQECPSQCARGLSKTIDVWSLGCIYSMAATFVVHGSTGVLQFDRIRRSQNLRESGNRKHTDAFHNGHAVLDVVKDWHDYLRATLRHTDPYTARILHMVENFMLVDSEKRSSAKQICEMLEGILEADPAPAAVSSHIVQLLQQVEYDEDVLHEDISGFKTADEGADLVEIRKRLPDVRVQPDPVPDTESQLFGAPLPPTSQRHITEEPGLTRTTTRSSSRSSRRPVPKRSMTGYSSETTRLSPGFPYRPADSPREPFNIWAMERLLDENGKQRELPTLRRGWSGRVPFTKRPISIRSNKALFANEPDILERFLQNRDIVFIIDNGSSMHDYWFQVQHLVKVLAWRLLGYDEDGMEMYFTNPQTGGIKSHTKQQVHDFEKALQEAKPHRAQEHLASLHPILDSELGKYIMADSFKWPNQQKSKTIIVVTDGAWLGQAQEGLVDHVIKSKLDILLSAYKDATTRQNLTVSTPDEIRRQAIKCLEESSNRPITIQFIQVGHNPNGLRRLRRLDDDLPKEGYPDLIDMEPADGDAYKMILGSLCSEIDNKVTVVNSVPSPTEPVRVQSLGPPSLHLDTGTHSRELNGASPITSPRSPSQPTDPGWSIHAPQATVSPETNGSPYTFRSQGSTSWSVPDPNSSPLEPRYMHTAKRSSRSSFGASSWNPYLDRMAAPASPGGRHGSDTTARIQDEHERGRSSR